MAPKMLRWIGGVEHYEDVRDKCIRNRHRIPSIVKKLHGRDFRWYSHVIRAGEKTVLNIEVNAKRSKSWSQ